MISTNRNWIFLGAILLSSVILLLTQCERSKDNTAEFLQKPSARLSQGADWVHQLRQPPPDASDTEKWKWWHEMERNDPAFSFKIPMEFYGKVVDEGSNPVADAAIEFSWTTANAEGSLAKSTVSNGGGLFQLVGERGGTLVVNVRKEGYERSLTRNKFSFEYARFSDSTYHVPDASRPVIFILHKKRTAEPLVVRENQEREVAAGGTGTFPIAKGVELVVKRPPSAGTRDDWNAQISIEEGELALALEEFPILAPETGYRPSWEINKDTPKPPVWHGDNGTAFYFKTAKGFGRIVVRNTPGMNWVYVSSYFNPNPGSRILEYDPGRIVREGQ